MDLRLRDPLRKRCRGTEDTLASNSQDRRLEEAAQAPETLRQEYGRRARVGAAAPAGAAAGRTGTRGEPRAGLGQARARSVKRARVGADAGAGPRAFIE